MSDKPKWSDLFGIAADFTLGDDSEQIKKGSRLRIVREGEPDAYVIVEDVKEDGPTTILTTRPGDVPPQPYYFVEKSE